MQRLSTTTHGALANVKGPADQTVVTVTQANFIVFYEQAYPRVTAALAYTLSDVDLAREATDEAMLRAYQRWDVVGGYDNPGAWVHRVGLNWARSFHRRLARKLPLASARNVELPPLAEPTIRQALLDLDEGARAVIVCRLLLDWSVEDTAQALGIRPGTVKSRQHRALHQLQSTLSHLRPTS